jgi:hypothetical protein
MAVKFFKNAYTGNASSSIAINPAHVMSVWETMYVDEQTNATTVITNIFGITGQTWQIDEPLLEVVARLNEKD